MKNTQIRFLKIDPYTVNGKHVIIGLMLVSNDRGVDQVLITEAKRDELLKQLYGLTDNQVPNDLTIVPPCSLNPSA